MSNWRDSSAVKDWAHNQNVKFKGKPILKHFSIIKKLLKPEELRKVYSKLWKITTVNPEYYMNIILSIKIEG